MLIGTDSLSDWGKALVALGEALQDPDRSIRDVGIEPHLHSS